jgi:hypothetical protein
MGLATMVLIALGIIWAAIILVVVSPKVIKKFIAKT